MILWLWLTLRSKKVLHSINWFWETDNSNEKINCKRIEVKYWYNGPEVKAVNGNKLEYYGEVNVELCVESENNIKHSVFM